MSPAGRPRTDPQGSKMAYCQVTIDPATRRHLERVGLGDVSAGIRILADLDRCKPGHQRWHYVIVRKDPQSSRHYCLWPTGYSTLKAAEKGLAQATAMYGQTCYLTIRKRGVIRRDGP